MKPLAIDLFCGLGGWTDGLLAEGYDVIGFDITQHVYGEHRYPGKLVIQDVTSLHGAQFKDAALIVASPPCQAYSYRAMPWKRAKALPPPDNTLFEACFRIQREACEAAGLHIPLIVENVRGAQPWVGRARWNFGSFYLWGDVPALMPITLKAIKVPTMGAGWYPPDHPKHVKGLGFNTHAARNLRNGRRTDPGKGARFTSRDCGLEAEGVKQRGSGREWFAGEGKISRLTGSKSPAHKMASAMIAKIPLPLSRYRGDFPPRSPIVPVILWRDQDLICSAIRPYKCERLAGAKGEPFKLNPMAFDGHRIDARCRHRRAFRQCVHPLNPENRHRFLK